MDLNVFEIGYDGKYFDFHVGAGTSPIGVSIDFPSIGKDLEDLFKGN